MTTNVAVASCYIFEIYYLEKVQNGMSEVLGMRMSEHKHDKSIQKAEGELM